MAGETAFADLYAEAIRRWMPELLAEVLPVQLSLTADGELPPDPGGAESASKAWLRIAADVIRTGASLLWSATVIRAMRGLGITPPAPAGADWEPDFDPFAVDAVARALDMDPADVVDSAGRVAADGGLAASMTDHLDTLDQETAKVPGAVFGIITATIAAAPGDADIGTLRASVELALAPGSVEMEDIEEWCARHSGAALNDAIVEAGRRSPEVARAEKVWISTHDSRTRPTHVKAYGQRVPLDGMFRVGSDRLEYPCDPSGSPEEVANCRCRVTVLMSDEALPKYVGSEVESVTASGQETTMEDQQTYRTFTDAVIALTGTPTSDGRMLSSDIELSFRTFPLPLMWTRQSSEGHLDAYTVGVLEDARVDDGRVLASGYLLNNAEADEAADHIVHGVTGPSVDLAAAEWILTDAEGNEPTAEAIDAADTLDLFQTITKAELIGTTLVATPAFGDTTLALNADRESRDVALVASAAEEFRPRVYDHRLFEDPRLTEPTLPTMGADGRIYGHLACFGQCHRSIQSECVVVPRSATAYAHFHTSPALRLDNGTRLPVGRLTVGTGHASDRLGARPAAAHYDNTGSCFALVRVGEDAHGVWFSGIAAPWATAEQVEMGLAAPLSGDWRDFGSGLELVAALAVNTPGFAARGRSDDQGRPLALVASLGPTADAVPDRGARLNVDEIKVAVREAMHDAAADAERDRLAAESAALLARAAEITHPPTPAEEIAALLAGRG